jgi:hypothetical protein
MPFSEKEVTHILALLQKGEVVKYATCSSRYIQEWMFKDGQWIHTDWEEGTTSGGVVTEAEMRTSIGAADDEAFAKILGPRLNT